MLEYRIVCGDNTEELTNNVTWFLGKRWKPQGGIAVAAGIGCSQAMVRNKCEHTSREDDNTCRWCGDVIDEIGNKS